MEKRNFVVGLLRVKPIEVSMLDRAFQLSQYRSRVYSLLDSDAPFSEANIIIVDGPPPQSTRNIPIVTITNKAAPDNDAYQLERPLLPNRVLKVLDRVTMEVFHYRPELQVGADVDPETGIFDNLKDAARGKTEVKPTGWAADHKKMKVMVVDDSILVHKQMELILSGIGIQADFVSDGVKALEMQKEHRYDLIFLDVMMPGLDGFQTCRALRKIDEEHPPKVVMLTSKGSAINRAHGKLVGASAYMTKPATRETLIATMEKLFPERSGNY